MVKRRHGLITSRSWQQFEKRRNRLLRTLHNREQKGEPPPVRDWFRGVAWDTVETLEFEEMVVVVPAGVTLTDRGRAFIRKHLTQREADKPDIRADEQARNEPK